MWTKVILAGLVLVGCISGPLSSQPAPYKRLPQAPKEDQPPTVLKGWGTVVDPDGDCKFATKGGQLTMTVPKGNHNLWETNVTAPRVLQDVEGDFSLQVRVTGFPQPAEIKAVSPTAEQVTAGLLLWEDDKKFTRMQLHWYSKAKMVDPKTLTVETQRQQGPGFTVGRAYLSKDIQLRLQRKANTVTLAYLDESKADQGWIHLYQYTAAMPSKLKAGVFACNFSTVELALNFSDLRLTVPVWVQSAAFLSDASRVLLASDKEWSIWEAATGRQLRRIEIPSSDRQIRLFQALRQRVLLDDGRTVLSLEPGPTKDMQVLKLRDLDTDKHLHSVEVPKSPIQAISPDGATLLAGGNPEALTLLDSKTGKPLRTFAESGINRQYVRLKFTLDGRGLIALDSVDQVRIWDTGNGRLLKTLSLAAIDAGKVNPPEESARHVVFSPDDRWVARLQTNGVFTVHELATGRLRLSGGATDQTPVAFSPDSKMFVWGGGADGRVRLIELATGGQRKQFTGQPGPLQALAFSSDGKALVSCGFDGVPEVWDLTGRSWPKTPIGKPLSAVELDACWSDLASRDADQAFLATRRLGAAPADSVPYLGAKLSPVPKVDEKRIAVLVTNLDNESFSVREAATKELEKIGEAAASILQTALTENSSFEFKLRAQSLLHNYEQLWSKPGGSQLQALRGIETLELAATAEAQQILQRIAAGATGARGTVEAALAVERFAKLKKK
jgi:WD40 repeat protein